MQSAPTRSLHAPAGASRMTLANLSRGKLARPIRAIVYGVEGVGKSTFGAQAPAPIFLCAEDGTAHLDVARLPVPRDWADVLEAVRILTHEEHTFKTLVIDTLDWLEPLCWAHVCATAGKPDIEAFGYGKGYAVALDAWRGLVARLDTLVRSRKMNVILLAHCQIRKQDDPQAGAFDRYRMKLHDRAGEVFREWVDAVLFARHEVRTVERNGKARGQSSGARLLHTEWCAAFDAKNRFDLPPALPLDWQSFEEAARAHVPADPERLKAELAELLPRLPESEQPRLLDAISGWAGNDAARLAQLADKARGKVFCHEASSAAEGGAS